MLFINLRQCFDNNYPAFVTIILQPICNICPIIIRLIQHFTAISRHLFENSNFYFVIMTTKPGVFQPKFLLLTWCSATFVTPRKFVPPIFRPGVDDTNVRYDQISWEIIQTSWDHISWAHEPNHIRGLIADNVSTGWHHEPGLMGCVVTICRSPSF